MSDFNLEISTAKESRSTSAINHLSVFLPQGNLAIESYEDPGVPNGIEVRGPVRTEDIVDDTDPTVNLHEFFLEQLRESKDRMYLLQLEDQFISLIQDSPHTLHYQHVTSYHRMLIHRMATYFGLHHTLDDEGSGVNVTKVAKSRMPETRFCDLIPAPQEGDGCDKEPVVILRRKYHTDPPIRPNPQIIRPASPLSSDSDTKSIKQREETYAMVRARIFEGEDEELVPLKPEDNLVPTETCTILPNSTDAHVSQESLSADPSPAPAAVPVPVPVPVITPLSRPKEESDLILSSSNNKTHISNTGSNSNRRKYDNNNNNRHSRGKTSFPNQPSHQTHFPSQLFVPSNLPYLQLGSFYPPQNEGNIPMYPVHRHPPPATHSSLPLHPSLPILPTQTSIPISSQHFLPQSQRPETAPFIPGPHMTNAPQPTLQLPINPTAAAVNPPLQYPASFPVVGLQPANSSLLQRTSNPAFQAMQPSSDVISYLPQVAPCEPPKEDAYLYMPGYANQMGPAYPGVQWEQSAPGVLKLKPQPPSQQIPHSLQQLSGSLEMMGIHGEEHMYLHPSAKHVSPGGDVYPGYSPYPAPNSVQAQGVYMQNNIAFLPYQQQYQNQDASLLPHVIPMSNSRLVLPHPHSTPATASVSLPESGYPLLTPPLPVRSVIANMNPTASLTNGQQFLPHAHGQMLQHTLLNNHLAVANQSIQEFQVNNHNFKNLKHSKSAELLFNQEISRSKLNRHPGSRDSSNKSRHRVHPQGNQPMPHKQSGSIYIPPRSGADAHPLPGDKDGLLPTPASMRILEIFELKVSFEEAERCVREIAHVHVDFHSIRSPNTSQEVLLAIFESEQLTDILNKINSNPATKFKTRFPDQNLVKYLSSTILQPTASN